LAWRFQLVQVEEPVEAAKLEQHHGVQVLDAAIHDAVKLSHRYISGRQLPDKAISVLDTACASVALAQHDVPAQLESLRHRQAAVQEELERLRREQPTGLSHDTCIGELESEATVNGLTLRELETRWGEEREAVRELLEARREALALSAIAECNKPDEKQESRINCLAAKLARLESGLEAIRQG
jgi:type VI secretion system protein VasG